MKRYINYLIILVIVLFGGVSRVEGASELFCSYAEDGYSYYIYQDPANNIKPFAVRMKKADKHLYSYGKITLNIKDGTDANGYLDTSNASDVDGDGDIDACPKSEDGKKVTTSSSKVVIKKNVSLTATNYANDVNYTSWSCDYAISKNFSVNVKQDKFGMITYSYTKNEKSYDGKALEMFYQSYGSSSCPAYMKNSSYDGDKFATFDVEKRSTSGYVSAKDISTGAGSGTSSTVCNSKGENCEYSSLDVANAKVCVYENAGYCPERCLHDNCSPSDCVSGTDVNSRFRTSSYMLMTYNGTTGKISDIYLPKIGESNSIITDRVTAYRYRGASASYLADLFDKFSYTSISAAQLLNVCENDDDNCFIESCPDWISGTISGLNAYEYDDSEYFWKRIDVTLEQLDEDHSENSDGFTDKDHFEGESGGPFFCKYNDGNMILKVNYGSNLTKMSVFFPNDPDMGSAFYSYKYGSGTEEPVSWVSAAGAYGKYESANDGHFETLLSGGTCPAQVVYGVEDGSLTICDKESDCEGVAGYQGKNPQWSKGEEGSNDGNVSIDECGDLISEDLREILDQYFLLFRIIVPILVLVLGTVDFMSAVFASNEDGMKKAQSKFIKRLIIAVAIFLLPTFVNLLMDIAETVWGWNSDDCRIG